MNAHATIPISERQRLFEFRFACRPTPKHPSFMTLQRVDFFVWLFDETPDLAARRAVKLMNLFPFEYDPQVTAEEITNEKIAGKQYPGWQLLGFVNAHRHGIHYGFFAEDQKPDGFPAATESWNSSKPVGS